MLINNGKTEARQKQIERTQQLNNKYTSITLTTTTTANTWKQRVEEEAKEQQQ